MLHNYLAIRLFNYLASPLSTECLFYLPVGFTIANGDMVVDNTQPSTELCKAAHKLGIIIHPDIVWPDLTGNQVIIQELNSPPAM